MNLIVFPTSAPGTGFSKTMPMNASMSSTDWYTFCNSPIFYKNETELIYRHTKGSFIWDLVSAYEFKLFLIKIKLPMGRLARSANLRPGILVGNSLNSCPDSDIRKNWL